MSRSGPSPPTLPIVYFVRAMLRKPDLLAIGIAGAILLFSVCILVMPLSRTVQVAAARRFQLAGWPFAAWAVLQPLPSMYNFENRWDVTFTPTSATVAGEACRADFRGFINHHIFNRILLQRVPLERCGLPAEVHFRTTFRGMTVESRYELTGGPELHGFVVTLRSK